MQFETNTAVVSDEDGPGVAGRSSNGFWKKALDFASPKTPGGKKRVSIADFRPNSTFIINDENSNYDESKTSIVKSDATATEDFRSKLSKSLSSVLGSTTPDSKAIKKKAVSFKAQFGLPFVDLYEDDETSVMEDDDSIDSEEGQLRRQIMALNKQLRELNHDKTCRLEKARISKSKALEAQSYYDTKIEEIKNMLQNEDNDEKEDILRQIEEREAEIDALEKGKVELNEKNRNSARAIRGMCIGNLKLLESSMNEGRTSEMLLHQMHPDLSDTMEQKGDLEEEWYELHKQNENLRAQIVQTQNESFNIASGRVELQKLLDGISKQIRQDCDDMELRKEIMKITFACRSQHLLRNNQFNEELEAHNQSDPESELEEGVEPQSELGDEHEAQSKSGAGSEPHYESEEESELESISEEEEESELESESEEEEESELESESEEEERGSELDS